MNWLMYIGGGFLWWSLWVSIIKDIDTTFGFIIHLLAIMGTWVWICWRFI